MSQKQWTLMAALGLMSAGCPGTIDDPDGFREQSSAIGASPLASDAGEEPAQPARDAATWVDASVQTGEKEGGTEVDASTGGTGAGAGTGGGNGSDAGTAGAGASCDFKGLMQTKCGTAACHGGPSSSTGLDLTTEGLAARVRGKRGSNACADSLMIDPDNPEKSVLYLSVTEKSCSIRMPIGKTLSDAEQACILQWIEGL